MNEKEQRYALLLAQIEALTEGERDAVANMANTAAALWQSLEGLNWAGFYRRQGDQLILGPFQGKPACIRIPLGRGVCGTAAGEDATQLVPDVHQFAGHIACDSASNSEIVIPLHSGGQVVGVLDMDSPLFARFDETDQRWLEQIAETLSNGCDWKL